LSFFDEGDDRPRGSGGGARGSTRLRRATGGGGGGLPNDQTLLVRRGIAIAAAVLLVILLVVAVKGCLDSQQEDALKEYNRDVGALVTESDAVGDRLFELLGGAARAQGQALQVRVNGLRGDSDRILRKARNLDVPDEMGGAQDDFVTVLELRRDALARTAAELPAAQSDSAASAGAVARIAGQMQAFLASDVLYSQRVVPQIQEVFDDNDISGQKIAQSRFIDDPLSWLDRGVVAERVGGQSGAGARRRGRAAPGLHGHGLVSVSAGDVTLDPDTANRIPASGQLTFTVRFANQGDNEEVDVPVKVSITGAGKPIAGATTVDKTEAGAEAEAEVPLRGTPPIGTPVTVRVAVNRVRGEQKADNNVESYPAVFTR